jgi:hypothetical protein
MQEPSHFNNNKTYNINNGLHNLLRWLGYHDVPADGLDTNTKHSKYIKRDIIISAAIYLFFEILYAALSIVALSKYITPDDITLDIYFYCWGSIGILRYMIKLSNDLYRYHSSKKSKKNDAGEYSTIGNALYRKRYKPYFIGLLTVGLAYLLIVVLSQSGMMTANTYNIWILPLVWAFAFFFASTAFLGIFDVYCNIVGYKPAMFNVDLKDQLKEEYK